MTVTRRPDEDTIGGLDEQDSLHRRQRRGGQTRTQSVLRAQSTTRAETGRAETRRAETRKAEANRRKKMKSTPEEELGEEVEELGGGNGGEGLLRRCVGGGGVLARVRWRFYFGVQFGVLLGCK